MKNLSRRQFLGRAAGAAALSFIPALFSRCAPERPPIHSKDVVVAPVSCRPWVFQKEDLLAIGIRPLTHPELEVSDYDTDRAVIPENTFGQSTLVNRRSVKPESIAISLRVDPYVRGYKDTLGVAIRCALAHRAVYMEPFSHVYCYGDGRFVLFIKIITESMVHGDQVRETVYMNDTHAITYRSVEWWPPLSYFA